MIDPLTELIEFLVAWRDHRMEDRREYVDRYVKPAFDAAEQIYGHYHELLLTLRREVTEAESIEPILESLDERRQELRPVRDRMRSVIRLRLEEGRATRFEAGILGLLSGSIASADRPYIQLFSFTPSEGETEGDIARVTASSGHTVLDILAKAQRQPDADIDHVRADVLAAIDDKLSGIELAWQDVTDGYAELDSTALPPPRHRRRSKVRHLEAVPEIQARLNEFHDMFESGSYSREAPKQFEQLVDEHVPGLTFEAQEIRQTIHDLADPEERKNILDAQLLGLLDDFERKLDQYLAEQL